MKKQIHNQKNNTQEWQRRYDRTHKEQKKKYQQTHKKEISERKKQYYQKNKKTILMRDKEYYQNHKLEINKRNREYYRNNKLQILEQCSKYRKNNKEKILQSKREHYKKHREEIIKTNAKYRKLHKKERNQHQKNRIKTDINYKIRTRLAIRIWGVLKNSVKSTSTMKLLGCSIEFFKHYVESKFKSGMSWSNYGKKGWVIDHIRPCASFDLSKSSEQRKCFHYTNLQPLWAKENLKKGIKLYKKE